MAKRPSLRSLRAARTYTIEEAADTLGVSIGTVRAWTRVGLPVLKAARPYLILGETLRDFLQARATKARVRLQPEQLYCFICKAPRRPYGMLADLMPQSPRTARLAGLCEVCGGTCNRMISRSAIARFSEIFDIGSNGRGTA